MVYTLRRDGQAEFSVCWPLWLDRRSPIPVLTEPVVEQLCAVETDARLLSHTDLILSCEQIWYFCMDWLGMALEGSAWILVAVRILLWILDYSGFFSN